MRVRIQGFSRHVLLPSLLSKALLSTALLSAALVCTAAKPVSQESSTAQPVPPVRSSPARASETRAVNLPSSVLDPVNEKKIHVSSTDSKGDCPSGATKIDKCSGVYPNGNSWEISPCCRTVTD